MSRQLSVLDLAVAHQEALLAALAGAAGAAEVRARRARGRRLLPRGPLDVRDGPAGIPGGPGGGLLERRQTELSRQLSSFLADASLALDAHDSLEEMLQLVAEQARELVGADCCVATVATAGRPRSAEAASYAEGDRRWTTLVRWLDLLAIYELVRRSGGSVRVPGEQLATCRRFATSAASARSRAGSRRP